MSDARSTRDFGALRLQSAAGISPYELQQAPTGEAAVYDNRAAAGAGAYADLVTRGVFTVNKTAGVVLLAGGRAYWDHSANAVTFRKVNDRDFYCGRVVEDATSAATSCVVDLNADPPYDRDLVNDPYNSTLVGTAAAGGLSEPRRQGSALVLELTATNEAQKVDALGVDGWATGANAIIEGAFRVISDGAGTVVDVSLGMANGTSATDADAITESVFVHLDANDTTISAESDDGTTEVAATDTTTDYTEGSAVANRKEFWIDTRNPADVQIYVDGVLVLDGTTFDVSAATGPWFLLAHVEKTASTDTYKLALDWLRARFSEQ